MRDDRRDRSDGGCGGLCGCIVFADDVNLAVKSVAEDVLALGFGTNEKQMAILAENSVGVRNADAVLAAVGFSVWPRVHRGEQLPAALERVLVTTGFRVKI